MGCDETHDTDPCKDDAQQNFEEIRSLISAKSVFSIQEAAVILSLPEKTVYRLIDYGDLKGIRIKGKWRIQQAEMLRWVEEQIEPQKEDQ